MKRGKIDKTLLIDKTLQLFQEKGYHNTTMDDIAKACRIQKSSLYHHIPSRKMLVMQVITHLLTDFKNNYHATVYDTTLSTEQKSRVMAASIQSFFVEKNSGQLLGCLAVELAHGFSEIKALFHDHFNGWIDAIAHLLGHNYKAEEAKMLAQDIVSQIQGAIVLQHAYGHDVSLFKRAIDRLTHLAGG